MKFARNSFFSEEITINHSSKKNDSVIPHYYNPACYMLYRTLTKKGSDQQEQGCVNNETE